MSLRAKRMPARVLLRHLEDDFHELDKIWTLYDRGLGAKDIGCALDRPRAYVESRLTGMGVSRQRETDRRVSEAQRTALVVLHEQGLSVANASRALGVSAATIHKTLRSLGYEPTRETTNRHADGRFVSTASPTLDAQIRELYEEHGIGMTPIARRIGTSVSFVKTRLDRMGVKTRPRGGGNGDNHLRLSHAAMTLTVGLYRKGYSMLQIAEALGLATSTVQYRLASAGVPRRQKSEAQRLRKTMPDRVTITAEQRGAVDV